MTNLHLFKVIIVTYVANYSIQILYKDGSVCSLTLLHMYYTYLATLYLYAWFHAVHAGTLSDLYM